MTRPYDVSEAMYTECMLSDRSCSRFTIRALRKNDTPPPPPPPPLSLSPPLELGQRIGIRPEKIPAHAEMWNTLCTGVTRTPRVYLIRSFRYRDARRVCVTWPARRRRARPSITTGFIGSIIPILGYVRRPARKYVRSYICSRYFHASRIFLSFPPSSAHCVPVSF